MTDSQGFCPLALFAYVEWDSSPVPEHRQGVSLLAIDASKVILTPFAPAARRVGNGAAPQRSPPTVGRLAR